MEWTVIDYCGTQIEAMDFLDGVIVTAGVPCFEPVFVPGWRIRHAGGDADAARLVRRSVTAPDYKIRFVLDE